ncbi:hypothetical protein FRC17_004696 [Serendipita sp. 399]|nr:hypothetical protein FRC17_004696 [Serendipita sp. 399]
MGSKQGKPYSVGKVQLLQVFYKNNKQFVTKSPEDFEVLVGVIRERFEIPPTERIDISTKLKMFGYNETELDPDTWGVLRPKIYNIWVSTRPMPITVVQPIDGKIHNPYNSLGSPSPGGK